MTSRISVDAYRLTNFATWRKWVATLAIVAGVLLFLSSWVIAWLFVGWLFAHDASMYQWATQLADVAWGHPMVFSTLVLAHLVGLLFILSVSRLLCR